MGVSLHQQDLIPSTQVMSGLSKPSYTKWQLQHAFRLLSTEQAAPHHIGRAALQHHLVRSCRLGQHMHLQQPVPVALHAQLSWGLVCSGPGDRLNVRPHICR